ncbi:MAG: hypothetical protein Q9196_003510 [Gyalolechia fulgens]
MEAAQTALHYAAPVTVLLYYLGASAVSVCTLQNGRKHRQNRSRRATTYGIYVVLVTYAVQSGLLILDSLSTTPWISSVAANVNSISLFLLWSTEAIILHHTRRPVWYLYYGSWLITLAFEIVILSLFASQRTVLRPAGLVLVVMRASRVAALLGLVARYVTLRIGIRQLWSDEESASLLGRKAVPNSRHNSTLNSPGDYGSTAVTTAAHYPSKDTEDSDLEDQVDRESKNKQRPVTERLKRDGPVRYFALAHKHILGLFVDAEALLRLFRQEPKVKDGPNEFRLEKGAVEFKDVQFSYDGSKPIIKGLNLIVQPGQKIAFVGETGGGKSTLLKLLFRFYDATKGSLLVDGQDVRDVTAESLRRCMGVVPQDPSMFNDSVMNNVRYSKLDATDEEVMEACKAAAIHDKVLSFTDGYSTIVGEKGVKLSGGELQRLAIARAILKDPSIILLDEATSSVDTETESRIQSALSELTKGRTTFTVAHRLSTVIDADTILVIKDGGIVEQGSPKELLAAKGKYYDLWCKQVGIISKTEEKTTDEATHDDHGSSENEQAGPGSSEHRQGWRPDAPEFVPRHLQSLSRPDTNRDRQKTQASDDIEINPSKHKSGEQSTAFNKAPSTGNKLAHDDADKIAGLTRTDTAADNRDDDTPHGSDKPGNDSDGDQKRTRLNRARRRKMSRSEPTGSSMSVGEGDFEPDREGSGEWPATERRRVSAPSKPRANEAGKTAGQGRRNRRKHWRVRQHSSAHAQSETQSAQIPGEMSAQSSLPTSSVPTTAPAPIDGDSKDPIVAKGNVRFSRGA